VDADKNFYFLEMNTRLQVEHPVTELVTGLDLVHWQIRIAQGEKLSFAQKDVQLRGHAIECRVYAEDPENNFFPSPGLITKLEEPAGPGIRIDSGVYAGWKVPIDYDPLLAKLIGYGADREQATAKLLRALDEYFVGGIKTNLALFKQILADPRFVEGKLSTAFLDNYAKPTEPNCNIEAAAIAAGLFAAIHTSSNSVNNGANHSADSESQRTSPSSWKNSARREALQ
jgi:acetyl-CoA carboxylase biotin carboxylase subunit